MVQIKQFGIPSVERIKEGEGGTKILTNPSSTPCKKRPKKEETGVNCCWRKGASKALGEGPGKKGGKIQLKREGERHLKNLS